MPETAPAAGLFVAGTDTGVGKTRAAVSIVRALARRGLVVAAMKPVAAGAVATAQGLRNADAASLAAAASRAAPYELVNPYCLPAAVSPHLAAAEAGIDIELTRLAAALRELGAGADCVIVEGAGGWLAPIGTSLTMADVADTLELPVLLVVGLRLGCLSHALLTARAVRASGHALAGWIGNRIDPGFERAAENLATLERWLGAAPIAVLEHAPQAHPHGPAASGLVLEHGAELPDAAVARLLAALRTTCRMSDRAGVSFCLE